MQPRQANDACSEIVGCMRSSGDNGPGSEDREPDRMVRDRDTTQLKGGFEQKGQGERRQQEHSTARTE
jgi:hypothetical protein